MWNLCRLSGKGGVVCKKLRKRMIDVRRLQEVRWRGQGIMMLGEMEGDERCGGLEKEVEWQLWETMNCVKR